MRPSGATSMRLRMKASLVCDVLRIAIWLRRPELGLVVHSDSKLTHSCKCLTSQDPIFIEITIISSCYTTAKPLKRIATHCRPTP